MLATCQRHFQLSMWLSTRIVFDQQFWTIKFELCQCCKVLATLRCSQFITVPSVKFNMIKFSIWLVDSQVCIHLSCTVCLVWNPIRLLQFLSVFLHFFPGFLLARQIHLSKLQGAGWHSSGFSFWWVLSICWLNFRQEG